MKEDIILSGPSAPTEYSFRIACSDPSLEGAGLGRHLIGGEFEIGGVFVYDASGAIDSEAASLAAIRSGGSISATISVSKSYLEDPDRAFPVVIDPSITISGSATPDTHILSFTPNTNYNSGASMAWLWTGKAANTGIYRTLIKFDIPSSVSNVTSSKLRLHMASGNNPASVRANRALYPWGSSTATWNNQPTYTTTGQSSAASSEPGGWKAMNVSTIVASWANGTNQNNGFVVKEDNETVTNCTGYESADAGPPNRPELVIEYSGNNTTSGECEVFWFGHTGGSGERGSASIQSTLNGLGYNAHRYENCNANGVRADMHTDKVFVVLYKGSTSITGVVNCYNNATTMSANAVLNNPNNYSLAAAYSSGALSSMKFAYYGGSYSAHSGVYGDLLGYTTSTLKAKLALGFSGSIIDDYATRFEKLLFTRLAQGYTVENAAYQACTEVGAYYYSQGTYIDLFGGTNAYLIKGTPTTRID